VRDVAHFASYLEKVIPQARDEVVEQSGSCEKYKNFGSKCISVARIVRDAPTPDDGVYRLAIYLLVARTLADLANLDRIRFQQSPLDPEIRKAFVSLQSSPLQFKDFAHARRLLWGAMEHIRDCSHAPLKNKHSLSSKSLCWRHKHLDILEHLQIAAWGEIRSKVMLTVGSRLPTEMALGIFEYALATEDIPLDPAIWTEPKDPTGCRILKPEYVCGVAEWGAY
jgi:hypothetical protein